MRTCSTADPLDAAWVRFAERAEQRIGDALSSCNCVIGDGSWIGHGAVIVPGSTVGRHVVIGASSVVSGDIPDDSVAVGAPARVIETING